MLYFANDVQCHGYSVHGLEYCLSQARISTAWSGQLVPLYNASLRCIVRIKTGNPRRQNVQLAGCHFQPLLDCRPLLLQARSEPNIDHEGASEQPDCSGIGVWTYIQAADLPWPDWREGLDSQSSLAHFYWAFFRGNHRKNRLVGKRCPKKNNRQEGWLTCGSELRDAVIQHFTMRTQTEDHHPEDTSRNDKKWRERSWQSIHE
eukprot:jgi/Ulvmu1/7263/UM035_0050.1